MFRTIKESTEVLLIPVLLRTHSPGKVCCNYMESQGLVGGLVSRSDNEEEEW